MMRSSGTLIFYVDGEFMTNYQPILPSQYTISQPTSFEIGSGGSSARFFKGAVDEVRVYNRALSSAEVQQLYNFGAAGASLGPLSRRRRFHPGS